MKMLLHWCATVGWISRIHLKKKLDKKKSKRGNNDSWEINNNMREKGKSLKARNAEQSASAWSFLRFIKSA